PDIGVRLTGWSGQVYEPADYVPYIGRSPGYKEVYLVTGDSGQGMTTGVVSGLSLRDLMNGQENLWSALYDPMRKPLSPSTIGEYVSENVTMVKGIAEHVLPSKRTSDHDHKGGDIKDIDAIGPGEGSLCTHNGEKVAA